MPTGLEHLEYWQAELQSPCFVYVVRGRGSAPVKIGVAKDVRRRVSALQVGNPFALELLFVLPASSAATALTMEKELHRRASKSAVRGEWFAGEQADLVLLIVDGMAQRMREAHDGSINAPHFWSLFPKSSAVVRNLDWDFEAPSADPPDEEAGIAPLGEAHWPRISDMFMDGAPNEEIAAELDITVGRVERTMIWMKYRGGYELDREARRLRDWTSELYRRGIS